MTQVTIERELLERAIRSFEALRSNMGRNAPHLSGKVWGDAERNANDLRAALQAAPAQVERLQWCEQCGEGVVNFCRGKGEKCGYGFPKPGQPEPAQPVNQVLVDALEEAATSLETISRLAGRTHYVGDDGERVETYMGHHDEVRGYAASRAGVARTALAQAQAQPATNPWKDAVLDRLASHAMDAPVDMPPADILKRVIDMAVTMATDPAIATQPAQGPKPTNCRNCGGADNVLCGGQCRQAAIQKGQPSVEDPRENPYFQQLALEAKSRL